MSREHDEAVPPAGDDPAGHPTAARKQKQLRERILVRVKPEEKTESQEKIEIAPENMLRSENRAELLQRLASDHRDSAQIRQVLELELFERAWEAARGESPDTVKVLTPSPELAQPEGRASEIARRVLDSVPRRDREILNRFYVLEQSEERICAEMGLKPDQFHLMKSRAKARFGELGKRIAAGTTAPTETAQMMRGWPPLLDTVLKEAGLAPMAQLPRTLRQHLIEIHDHFRKAIGRTAVEETVNTETYLPPVDSASATAKHSQEAEREAMFQKAFKAITRSYLKHFPLLLDETEAESIAADAVKRLCEHLDFRKLIDLSDRERVERVEAFFTSYVGQISYTAPHIIPSSTHLAKGVNVRHTGQPHEPKHYGKHVVEKQHSEEEFIKDGVRYQPLTLAAQAAQAPRQTVLNWIKSGTKFEGKPLQSYYLSFVDRYFVAEESIQRMARRFIEWPSTKPVQGIYIGKGKDQSGFISTPEAARILEVSPRTVWLWASQGKAPTTQAIDVVRCTTSDRFYIREKHVYQLKKLLPKSGLRRGPRAQASPVP